MADQDHDRAKARSVHLRQLDLEGAVLALLPGDGAEHLATDPTVLHDRQRRAVQHLLTDNGMSDVTMSVWIPAADPTRFMEAGVSMDAAGREEARGTLTLGPMAIAAQFDDSGSLLTGHMNAGAVDMAMERVWADGTPP